MDGMATLAIVTSISSMNAATSRTTVASQVRPLTVPPAAGDRAGQFAGPAAVASVDTTTTSPGMSRCSATSRRPDGRRSDALALVLGAPRVVLGVGLAPDVVVERVHLGRDERQHGLGLVGGGPVQQPGQVPGGYLQAGLAALGVAEAHPVLHRQHPADPRERVELLVAQAPAQFVEPRAGDVAEPLVVLLPPPHPAPHPPAHRLHLP